MKPSLLLLFAFASISSFAQSTNNSQSYYTDQSVKGLLQSVTKYQTKLATEDMGTAEQVAKLKSYGTQLYIQNKTILSQSYKVLDPTNKLNAYFDKLNQAGDLSSSCSAVSILSDYFTELENLLPSANVTTTVKYYSCAYNGNTNLVIHLPDTSMANRLLDLYYYSLFSITYGSRDESIMGKKGKSFIDSLAQSSQHSTFVTRIPFRCQISGGKAADPNLTVTIPKTQFFPSKSLKKSSYVVVIADGDTVVFMGEPILKDCEPMEGGLVTCGELFIKK
jgi:hypothetical protein